jgi:hypothetical protein
MKTRRSFVLHASPLFALTALCLFAPAISRSQPPAGDASQNGQDVGGRIPSNLDVLQRKVSVDLNNVPLREALDAVLRGAKVQYALPVTVPDVRVTLQLSDRPLIYALEQVLKAARGKSPALRIQIEQDSDQPVVRVMEDEDGGENAEAIVPIAFARASDLLRELMSLGIPLFGANALDDANAIRLVGKQADLQRARDMIRLLDIRPKQIALKIEVVHVDATEKPGRSTLLALSATTPNNKPTSTTEKIGGVVPPPASGKSTSATSPAASSTKADNSLRVTASFTPHVFGDGSIGLQSKVDLSIPLATARKGETLRLEKVLDVYKRVKPGATTAIGGTTLSQYGLKGQVLIFVTATIDDSPRE